jgi:hypothetical protein
MGIPTVWEALAPAAPLLASPPHNIIYESNKVKMTKNFEIDDC